MFYLDTSALVKLIAIEDESLALRHWLEPPERQPASCDLARTELLRATRKIGPDLTVSARAVLDSMTLVALSPAILDAAGGLGPASLRSLDAVHLAAALTLGDDLEGMITYDDRQAEAAKLHGLAVMAPG